MDAWALNLNNCTLPLSPTKTRIRNPLNNDLGFGSSSGSVKILWKQPKNSSSYCKFRSLVVSASGQKKNRGNHSGNNDPSIPEGDGPEGNNPPYDRSKSSDSTIKSHQDWREFRANLVAHEQVHLLDPDIEDAASHDSPSKQLGPKWAHPLTFPEPGCVLLATEKLDGNHIFERTVILLLQLGTRDQREGPIGIIINGPLRKKIKHMNPSNPDFATIFADCFPHFGGPVDSTILTIFLIRTKDNSPIPGFPQVLPGICFGDRSSLKEAAELVKKGVLKAEDFRFFVGFAGWLPVQLKEEIESDYWAVAACSSDLINGGNSVDFSPGLWEEILQLMGGRYSELSQKPRQDSS